MQENTIPGQTMKPLNNRHTIRCQDCRISKLCLPVMLAESEVTHLDSIVHRGRPLNKGQHLIQAGEVFSGVFAIRSGSIKTYTLSIDGLEQITGFYLPGEIIGFDAISSGIYPGFAKALETSSICEIPFDKLEALAAEIPSLQRQIFRTMSQEIVKDQDLMLQLNKKSAEQRFASFLINLSYRFGRRGMSSFNFRLPMPRSDIGNYLGLAVETISRLINQLQKDDLVLIRQREVQIEDMHNLSILSGSICHS
jgi:CRP/FNR family transcriptional regulator